ncbi:MAG: hypothetical protein STSR0008_11640 [Ignavibacterium sp.]
MKQNLLGICSLIFLFSSFNELLNGQSKSNLDVFYDLVDSASLKVINEVPITSDTIFFNLMLVDDFNIFTNEIISVISSEKKNISFIDKSNDKKINFFIESAEVNYPKIFRKGFLGDYFLERKISLKGNYSLLLNYTKSDSFNYSFSDTIKYEKAKEFENLSIPFTQGQIPSEPLFSSIIEPIVLIGSAALTVFLFFNIRSK